jgi:hypothetical protein
MDDEVEASPERVHHHLRRRLAGSRNLLMKTAGNTVLVTDPLGEPEGLGLVETRAGDGGGAGVGRRGGGVAGWRPAAGTGHQPMTGAALPGAAARFRSADSVRVFRWTGSVARLNALRLAAVRLAALPP